MNETAIKFQNVSFRYKGKQEETLKRFNVEISSGKVWLLVGPTGSGKSTVLFLTRGFHKEFGGELQGEIWLGGKNLNDLSFYEIGKMGIGFVSQDPSLNLHQLTVIDEILSTPIYLNFPWAKCINLAEGMMRALDISELRDKTPSDLSGGQMQKVAIAAALTMSGIEGISGKGILLLDEPDSFLDSKGKDDLLKAIQSLKSAFTILIATHRPEFYAKLADGITLIDDGKNKANGNSIDLLYSDIFEETVGSSLTIKIAKYFKKVGYITSNPHTPDQLVDELTTKIHPAHSTNQVSPPQMTDRGVIYRNVSFRYTENGLALKNLSGCIPRKSLTAIIGNNGSGKTTLSKATLGLLKNYKGEIEVLGKSINKYKHSSLSKLGIYIPQIPQDFFLTDSVRSECELTARIHKLEDISESTYNALYKTKLLNQADFSVDSLSGGQRRLLTLAASVFLIDYPLIFIDEPEFGVDYNNLDIVLSCLVDNINNGGTAVILTHMLELTLLCDWIIIMHEGEIVKSGPPQNIYDNENELESIGIKRPTLLPVFKLAWMNNLSIKSSQDLLDSVAQMII